MPTACEGVDARARCARRRLSASSAGENLIKRERRSSERTVPGMRPGIWPVGCESDGDLRMRQSARRWRASPACSELCARSPDPTRASVQRAHRATRSAMATPSALVGLRAWRGKARNGRIKTSRFGRRLCCPGSDRRRGRRCEIDCRDGRIARRHPRPGHFKSNPVFRFASAWLLFQVPSSLCVWIPSSIFCLSARVSFVSPFSFFRFGSYLLLLPLGSFLLPPLNFLSFIALQSLLHQ